ncbi:MAG: response regulator, partial [Phycisphaerae bacterium]|nr:response regulator [Phycisphaerae bacterium]
MEPQPTAEPTAVRLLLIEDDPQVVEAVCECLADGVFTFEHAATVAEGRSCLGRQTFDILVLDLNLPDGSGLAIADELRAAGRELPILMLTARSAVDERVDGFRHGADDYLVKP